MTSEPYEKREGFEYAFVDDCKVEAFVAEGWQVAGSCNLGIVMERRRPEHVLKAALPSRDDVQER